MVVYSLCIERREVPTQTLKDALKNGDVGMSTDMWIDNYKKLSYIAIMCHFINNYTFVCKTLNTAMFPVEEEWGKILDVS